MNIIFDIDGTIAVCNDLGDENLASRISNQFGKHFLNKHRLEIQSYEYYVFPGFYALFKWLDTLDFNISFFSSGVQQRNILFKNEITKRVRVLFGLSSDWKVFSRQHCINTDTLTKEEYLDLETVFEGRLKKKLSGVVVPEHEIRNSLLIDDDWTFMVKGEEFNFIGLDYCHYYPTSTGKPDPKHFFIFHKAFYLAGLIKKILFYKNSHYLNLAEAANKIQIEEEGMELTERFSFPGLRNRNYYESGAKILGDIDSDACLYFAPNSKCNTT